MKPTLTACLLPVCLLVASSLPAGILGGVAPVPFGKTKDGREVKLLTLKNKAGMVVKITNYGGIVTEIHVPDRDGKIADVALGYGKLEDYIADSPYFGALIGRSGRPNPRSSSTAGTSSMGSSPGKPVNPTNIATGSASKPSTTRTRPITPSSRPRFSNRARPWNRPPNTGFWRNNQSRCHVHCTPTSI